MTDDLVKRLRHVTEFWRPKSEDTRLMREAADEIDRLSKDLKNAVWADSEMCRELEDAIDRKDAALRAALEALKPFAHGTVFGIPEDIDEAKAAIAKIKEALNEDK